MATEWTTQSVAESVWQIETTPGVPTIFLNSNSDIVKWANNTGNITAWVSTSAPFWVIS